MVAACGLLQFQVKPVIIIRIETRLPVIAALGDVLWYAWNAQARRAWHVLSPCFRSCHYGLNGAGVRLEDSGVLRQKMYPAPFKFLYII